MQPECEELWLLKNVQGMSRECPSSVPDKQEQKQLLDYKAP